MEKIASFQVDHTKICKGMYISRVDMENIITYDVRMKCPNQDDYLTTGGMHTMEHLFATFARNAPQGKNVVYVGPMGCRTGFYLITAGLPHQEAIQLVRDSMAFVRDFRGEIPGASEVECGNFRDQNLPEARAVADDMLRVLADWTAEDLAY